MQTTVAKSNVCLSFGMCVSVLAPLRGGSSCANHPTQVRKIIQRDIIRTKKQWWCKISIHELEPPKSHDSWVWEPWFIPGYKNIHPNTEIRRTAGLMPEACGSKNGFAGYLYPLIPPSAQWVSNFCFWMLLACTIEKIAPLKTYLCKFWPPVKWLSDLQDCRTETT